jgi:4-diphosphocytidyl-2-C-methyl-D-erythritol kinase
LEEVASAIGSDVKFFLRGGLALGRGRGDEISPLPDIRQRGVVVAMPELRISTASAFEELSRRLTFRGPDATVEAFVEARREAGTGDPPWGSLGNDFEELVTKRWPEIGRLIGAVRATAPLHAAITGSGAAVFGIYADRAAAREARRWLGSGWRVHVGSTLGNRRAALLDREWDPREEE